MNWKEDGERTILCVDRSKPLDSRYSIYHQRECERHGFGYKVHMSRYVDFLCNWSEATLKEQMIIIERLQTYRSWVHNEQRYVTRRLRLTDLKMLLKASKYNSTMLKLTTK